MVWCVKEDEKSLSANGSDSLGIDVAAGKTFVINRITFDSTGAFKITDIRDTATGYHYISGDLHSSLLKNKANANVIEIDPPITVSGSTTLIFDITDTSGSTNAIKMAFMGDES